MKTQSSKGKYEAQSGNILTLHEENVAQIGADYAGCDPDFDNVSDDEREIALGLRDLHRMIGVV